MARSLFTITLIFAAALTRLLPHPPNVAPITALALFSGVYLEKKHAFIVPLAAMLLSDLFLGFHGGMIWVYSSFFLIGLIGLWLKNHQGFLTTGGATLAGSLLFFTVTNFGVWLSSTMFYPPTMAGLEACYVAAIPFFRNTLVGDISYTALLFGIFEVARRTLPFLRREPLSL